MSEKIQFCACGCGGIPKQGNKYINGHNRRGVTVLDTTRKRLSEAGIKRFENSLEREKSPQAQKKRYENPEERDKTGKAMLVHHKDHPETAIKMSNSHKKRYEDPKEREKTSEAGLKYYEEHLVSNTIKEKLSQAATKRYEDIEERILQSCRRLGIPREDWDGFGSVYCELWCEELREYIRDKYNRVCYICGKTEEENLVKWDEKLSVHHVDYNKDCGCDDTECILVPLCKKCHGKTTFGDREMWENLIIKMLEGK